ncbi:HIRAN domain-containing protein [Streptomyces sp. NPDC006140]|uniref:HIRAN domain-containing protein n=1 Tax=Streptomyces sp. NPDC006140 TaxID=3154579 RepID=UPI00340AA545
MSAADELPHVFSSGEAEIEVVGEFFRAESIRQAVANMPPGRPFVAQLVPEPQNPHDPNAVAVHLQGQHVGYLPRQNAAILGPKIVALSRRHGGVPVACSADVTELFPVPQILLRLNLSDFGVTADTLRGPSSEFASTADRLTREILAGPSSARPITREDSKGRQQLQKAEAASVKAWAEADRDPRTLVHIEGMFRAALKRMSASGDPEIGRAWLGLARSLRYQKGRRDEVLTAFLTALSFQRDNEEAWREYLRYLCLSPSTEALASAFAAMPPAVRLSLAPKLLAVSWQQDRHGRLAAQEGPQLRKSLVEIAQAAGDHGTEALLTGQLGLREEKQGHLEQAVMWWRLAVTAGSTDPRIADRLSIALLKDGMNDEAENVLQKALADVPKGPAADRLARRLARCQKPLRPSASEAPSGSKEGYRCSACGAYGHNKRTCPRGRNRQDLDREYQEL